MNCQRKVMAVDDDDSQLAVISQILEKEGIDGVYMQNADNVVEVAEKEQPHLIILDLNMPYMGTIQKIGLDIVRKLKKCAGTKRIPIVILSSDSNKIDHINAIILKGCDDFLQKPISSQKLRDKINLYSYLGVIALQSGLELEALKTNPIANKRLKHV